MPLKKIKTLTTGHPFTINSCIIGMNHKQADFEHKICENHVTF